VPTEIAGPSVRFSLGHQTTSAEIDRVIALFPTLMARLREFAAAG
jgi:cysteine sulfinate desulfinase/cysteine desulfurase-like protein